MFALMLWFWVNLCMVFIIKLEIKVIPKNNILKVLMYLTFPLPVVVEYVPIFIGSIYHNKLKGILDKSAIRFINLIDMMNGTYGKLTPNQVSYIKNDNVKPYGKRYQGGK